MATNSWSQDKERSLSKRIACLKLLGMLQVQQEAKRAVASMLERAGMSDRIKSVMGMLRRYESLFRLPSRIMQETECGEFEAVS